MITKQKVQTTLLLLVGIVILVNLLSSRFFLRLDFTADQRYTLSKATKDILRDLEDPVTVTAYFSENMPADIERIREDLRDMLVEYSTISNGNVVYEFVNPNEDQQIEMEAQQSGISPVMINVREKDQMKQQRAYLGALIQLGEKKEPIPVIQPGSAMEFALSSSIKKIASVDKPNIALLQGNGEPTPQEMPQLINQLSIMYNVIPIEFSDTTGIDNSYKTLLVVAPKDTVNPSYFRYLEDFFNGGGRILLALNSVEGDLQNSQGKKVYTGFSDWLNEKGIEIEESFLIDANCASVTVQQRQGFFLMNTPVRFPYIPIITNFTEHPITKGLEAVIMPFASPINFAPKDTTVNMYPLALSSEKSGVQTPPIFFDVSKQWQETDFNIPNSTVGLAVEFNGIRNNKMVVFSDGDFIVNGEGQQAQQVQEDNISLMVNSVDWLTDDTGLIELRTKGITARPLDPDLTDGTKATLKYLNFLLPIILIVLYGIFRFQLRKQIRNKLQSVNYVQ